jgi:hypothetical protein
MKVSFKYIGSEPTHLAQVGRLAPGDKFAIESDLAEQLIANDGGKEFERIDDTAKAAPAPAAPAAVETPPVRPVKSRE